MIIITERTSNRHHHHHHHLEMPSLSITTTGGGRASSWTNAHHHNPVHHHQSPLQHSDHIKLTRFERLRWSHRSARKCAPRQSTRTRSTCNTNLFDLSQKSQLRLIQFKLFNLSILERSRASRTGQTKRVHKPSGFGFLK